MPQLIATLDAVLSRYVRQNYAVNGLAHCFTCGKILPIQALHCGHYIPRTESPTRHDEHNLRPQCVRCNTFRSGAPHEFRRRLAEEIGADAVLDLEARSKLPWKWDRLWLIEKIEYYREQLKGC